MAPSGTVLDPNSPQSLLINFYNPLAAGKDPRCRTLQQILAWSDTQLERSHDYIQVLFPLPEGSPFNWEAPVIDSAIFQAFRSRPELRSNLRRSFARILAFYGFDSTYSIEDVTITQSENHLKAYSNWVTRFDHNHLRITRIIRCLRVLGLEQNAQAFFQALQDVDRDFPNRIGSKSMMFWTRAATRPLYLAPHVDNDNASTGPQFLIDFEEQKSKACGTKTSPKQDNTPLESQNVEGSAGPTSESTAELEKTEARI